MAPPTEYSLYDESFAAAADLSTPFLAVEITAENTINVCNGAGDYAIGILQGKVSSGQAAPVRLLGRSKAVTDGSGTAISPGDFLKTANNGKLVKAGTDKDFAFARALQASTADGTIIDVLMLGGWHIGV